MELSTNNISDTVMALGPPNQLLLLQMLCQLSTPGFYTKKLSRSVELLQLRLENQKLKSELLKQNQKVLELERVIETSEMFRDIIQKEMLSVRDKNLLDIEKSIYNNKKDLELKAHENIKLISEVANRLLGNLSDMDLLQQSVKQINNVLMKQQRVVAEMTTELEKAHNQTMDFKIQYEHMKNVVSLTRLELKTEQDRNEKLREKFEEIMTMIKTLQAGNKDIEEYKLESLHKACNECNLRDVKFLMHHGAPVDKIDSTDVGDTAIHVAARQGCTQVVNWIARSAAIVNMVNKLGATPLHVSAEHNQIPVAGILIARGANLNAQFGFLGTPLHVATRLGHLHMVRLLLDYGAKVNARSGENMTALHVAAEMNQTEVAQLLINRNAEVGSLAVQLLTPLHLSAKNGHLNQTRLLLDEGADVDAKSEENVTALFVAAKNRHFDVVTLLLERGAQMKYLTDRKIAVAVEKAVYGDVSSHKGMPEYLSSS